MDDNDDLEFVEEDYYAFLNVPRNVSLILVQQSRIDPGCAPAAGSSEQLGFVI